MNIFDLLAKYSDLDQEAKYQMLHEAMTEAKLIGRKADQTKISFLTDAVRPKDFQMGTGPVGIVLWVQREWFEEESV